MEASRRRKFDRAGRPVMSPTQTAFGRMGMPVRYGLGTIGWSWSLSVLRAKRRRGVMLKP
jgi:hypothetical protein